MIPRPILITTLMTETLSQDLAVRTRSEVASRGCPVTGQFPAADGALRLRMAAVVLQVFRRAAFCAQSSSPARGIDGCMRPACTGGVEPRSSRLWHGARPGLQVSHPVEEAACL